MLEVERVLPGGSARSPALERDAGLGQLTGPRWLCRCAETCNQDVDPNVREEDLSTGKRWPERQESLMVLLAPARQHQVARVSSGQLLCTRGAAGAPGQSASLALAAGHPWITCT